MGEELLRLESLGEATANSVNRFGLDWLDAKITM